MEHLGLHIESIIFAAEQPITLKDIKNCMQEAMNAEFKKPVLLAAIDQLIKKYQDPNFAFELVEISEGYQFLTKGIYFNTIAVFLKQKTKKRLSKAALETLSIIAYKQPVPKSEMEKIRGVSCDYSIQKLLEKELVTIAGRSDGPGRPLLYGTSPKFMNYFGMKNLKDLPTLKDFKEPDSEIGERASADEIVEKKPTQVDDNPPT